MTLTPLAELSGLEFGLACSLASTFAAVAITGLILYFNHRRRVLWHETARIALEKGQPIPEPSPDTSRWNWQAGQAPQQNSGVLRMRAYLISGICNLAISAGMYIAFRHLAPVVSSLSAIPASVGVAMLLGAWLEHRSARKNSQ